MEIVPYKAEHLLAIVAQEAQQRDAQWITPEHAYDLEPTQAYTVLIDGIPVACGGVLKHWEGRFEAWAYLAADIGPDTFRRLHNAVKRLLSSLEYRRLEARVDCDFQRAHRWVRALGFHIEAPRMRRYCPDGRDAALYVKVN